MLDYQYNPVRQFTGQSSSLYAAWDGNDDSGNPLYYGFYDYYIEARPSRYGCLDGMSAMQMSSASRTATTSATAVNVSSRVAGKVPITPAAMQFSRGLSGVTENITIPSLNPTPPVVEANSAALAASVETPMVISYVGTNEFINGVPAILYPPTPPPVSALRLERAAASKLSGGLQPRIDSKRLLPREG